MADTRKEWTFKTKDGLELLAVKFPTPNASPKAVMVFNHGYGEHVARYNAGIEVRSFDMRTFGRSEPDPEKRGKIEHFADIVDDLEGFVADAKAAHTSPEVPLFLAGSSLGALVASHLVLRDASGFRGLLLFSPAIDVEWNPVLRIQAVLGGVLARLMPYNRAVAAVRLEDMTPDPAVQKTYSEDPLNFVGNVRLRTANEILYGMKQLQSRMGEIALPVYGQHGDKDVCTSVPAHKRFHEAIASKDKTLKIMPGGYHELLMGPEKEECTQAIIDWILQRAGPVETPNTSKI